ncbi:MAG: raffinose/stachyose/melibiose transport system permease protein [Clostridiales bacterium]|jgi:ABC-type glycerol-3-phosphate transport system permease component|nr:raffinose/stachyose/melibiose transport system permease protein [Clostridiales bacterium]
MKNSRTFAVVAQIICVIATAFFLYPLVLMFMKSLKNGGFNNYVQVLEIVSMWRNYLNSVYVVGLTLIIVSIATSLAAYAFSKLRFTASKQLYFLLLTGMMIPTAATIFPLFQVTKALGLINNTSSLIGPYATMNAVFNLLILKNYYDGLPNEMIEAARIDGAGSFATFARVFAPLSLPGLALVLIQTFLSAWNELQMGMTFVNKPELQTITVIPLRFAQTISGGYPMELLYACLVMALAPIIIFYAFAQKFLIAGLTAGAIKG